MTPLDSSFIGDEHVPAAPSGMRNSTTMNCEGCGRFVSRKTAGDVEFERSDMDGSLCIVAMWCQDCRKEQKDEVPCVFTNG